MVELPFNVVAWAMPARVAECRHQKTASTSPIIEITVLKSKAVLERENPEPRGSVPRTATGDAAQRIYCAILHKLLVGIPQRVMRSEQNCGVMIVSPRIFGKNVSDPSALQRSLKGLHRGRAVEQLDILRNNSVAP